MATSPAQREAQDAEREAFERRRKRRNLLVLCLLLGFVILIYVMTMVRTDTASLVG